MTTIKATCFACGEVELKPADVTLTVCVNKIDLSTYSFTHTECGRLVVKPADEHVQNLLISGGIRPIAFHIPEEALEEHYGDKINPDDILDFHLALHGFDDWQDLL